MLVIFPSIFRRNHSELFCQKDIYKNFAKYLCQKTPVPESFLNKIAGLRTTNLLKKEILAQLFSCEFCEILKNTFFYGTSLVAAFYGFNFIVF